MRRRTTRLTLAALCLLLCAAGSVARATSELSSLYVTPDITVLLNGAAISPQRVGIDDLAGNVVVSSIGELPDGTNVTAYHRLNDGTQLIAFDTAVDLGSFTALAGDVVRFNGSTYTLFFEAAAAGVPEGAITDALSLDAGGDLLLSFDITVRLGSLTVSPQDLVRYDGSTFTTVFNGAATGVPPGVHVDAVDFLQTNGHLLMSFDISGSIGAPPVDFDDEDVLEYAPEAGTWEMAYDGSAHYAGWVPGDLVAVFAFPVLPTPTPTATVLPSPTAAATATPVGTATQTPPATATVTGPPGQTPTATLTSGIVTPTGSPGATLTPTGRTATATATVTAPIGQSPTPTLTAEMVTPTGSPGATLTPTTRPACAGDCDGSGVVTVNELVLMVNIALGNSSVTLCEAGDTDHDGTIMVNEIVAAVGNALGSCPA